MTWYNDPDSGPPPSTPLPPPAQPYQQSPYQQPAQPYQQSPYQQPAQPYQQPPYQQPPYQQPPYQQAPYQQQAPPPPGIGGRSWRELLEPLKSRNAMVALGASVLAVALLGGGYFFFTRPDELSTREYARLACTDVLKPSAKSWSKITKSRDFKKLSGSDVKTQRDAERAITAVRQLTDLYRSSVVELGSFNDGQVLRGHDGEDFHTELSEAVGDFLPAIDQANSDLDALDPADEEDVVDEIRDILDGLDGLDISLSDGDPGAEVSAALYDRSDDCGDMFSRLVYQQSQGD
ncbi:MAG: hypothetical protein U0Q22_19670 [Acidimicrobiales bacterium]